MSGSDLKKLHAEIGTMVKAEETKNSIEAARQRKLQAALADPEAPVVRQALKTLDRLGLTPFEAADLSKLNARLDAQRWGTEERFRAKALLHSVGVI